MIVGGKLQDTYSVVQYLYLQSSFSDKLWYCKKMHPALLFSEAAGNGGREKRNRDEGLEEEAD